MESGLRDLPDLDGSYSTSDNLIENFYIPVLSASSRLDRSAGYFTSSSLSLAAQGLARLIANGGRMRLLVGSDLRKEDVEAIERGASLEDVTQAKLITLFQAPKSEVERKRLEALAWMVAAGTLTIRVGLPRGGEGYFHVKHGIATDSQGNKIAWQGSNNETPSGWVKNYEELWVSPSWIGDWPANQVRKTEESFQEMWEDRHPEWRTIPIPEAARQKLLTYKPSQPPVSDPEETPPDGEGVNGHVPDREAVIAAWLRDVPHLLGMEGRIGQTGAVQPWPHQSRVADDVVSKFPQRFLLADEVGLGKTIEVGLILRDLLISGTVRRCLILAPASVLVQWQGELFEKFGIAVPIYDGHQLKDPGPGQPVRPLSNPALWHGEPVVLVSSQLAKRTERRGEIWGGPDWDMVVIDEAHHARRKGYDKNRRRRNRLLELLEGDRNQPGLTAKTRGLLLLTATPMQVHPVEVWDLLAQLGLPGRWGADEDYFLRYFDELRKAPTDWADVNWRLVAEMARDELEHGGPIHKEIAEPLRAELGWVTWDRLQQCFSHPRQIRKIKSHKERKALLAILEHLTPLRRRMHRNTRGLLREYQKQGLLPARLAHRLPEPRWVEMAADEKALYDRVEEYISEFYNIYEGRRRGLGFVMTVYRRRLTSSFYALERSLQRRLKFLQGAEETGIVGEDWEEDDLTMDIGEVLGGDSEGLRDIYAQEIGYVEDFLKSLRGLGTDTKYAQLVEDLNKALQRRSKVVIFTQYTDTMDYLREGLLGTYGHRIACYSGRGGERWAGNAWERVEKEEIKRAFRKGDVQILLGNDAMAEGLNLQTCGVEINYDVPWNPMRLEQRIGRVDRIGQQFRTVWIWSYFLEDTIEAEVYRRLMDRIDWFQCVVGSLQPILHQVGTTIKKLALEKREIRSREMDKALIQIAGDITQTEQEGIDLERHLSQPLSPIKQPPPATSQQLEQVFTTSRAFNRSLRPHPRMAGAYQLTWRGREHLVTFSPELARERSDTLRLLTFGDSVFESLLSAVNHPTEDGFGLIRLETRTGDRQRVGWYRNLNGQVTPITQFSELIASLESPNKDAGFSDEAKEAFASTVFKEASRSQSNREGIREERRSVLAAQGRHLLAQATYNWAARHRNLFDAEAPPIGGATLRSMVKAEKYPWGPLSRLVGNGIPLSSNSREWTEATSKNDQQLLQHWRTLDAEARELIERPLLLADQPTEPPRMPTDQPTIEIATI